MQVGAISSAVLGMEGAQALQDRAAQQVADATAASADAGAGDAPPVGAEDDLVTAFVGLSLSDVLMKANAAVARTAEESYRSVLELG